MNTGTGEGGGAPQKNFSIIGAKILLKNQKKLTNKGGEKTVKISRNIIVHHLWLYYPLCQFWTVKLFNYHLCHFLTVKLFNYPLASFGPSSFLITFCASFGLSSFLITFCAIFGPSKQISFARKMHLLLKLQRSSNW